MWISYTEGVSLESLVPAPVNEYSPSNKDNFISDIWTNKRIPVPE